MHSPIKLLSIDFDGTLVSRVSEPVLDAQCMELIRKLQKAGAIWAINTGRSVDLLESGFLISHFRSAQTSSSQPSAMFFARGKMETNGSHLGIGTSGAREITPNCFLRLTRSLPKSWIS